MCEEPLYNNEEFLTERTLQFHCKLFSNVFG